MQKELLYKCFTEANALNDLCVQDLERLVEDAPYFQAAWMLLAKAKSKGPTAVYHKVLSQSAARVYNREQLFDFIYTQTGITEAPEPKVKSKIEKPPKSERKIVAATKVEKPKPIVNEIGEEIKTKDDLRQVVKDRLNAIDTKNKAEKSEKKPIIQKQEKQESPKSNVEIIDSFIKQNPGINKPKDAEYKEEIEMAARGLEEKFDFISETLAEINLKQGHHKKAIKIYEKLSLKYPEKSGYFAAQIKKIKS